MCNFEYAPIAGKLFREQYRLTEGTIQIDGSFREFSTSVYKGGSHQLRFRFSDQQFEAMKKLGKNPRQLAERGLEAFLNE